MPPPRKKKKQSLSTVCGPDAVHFLIQRISEHPALFSLAVTSEENLPHHCANIFGRIVNQMRLQFNRPDLQHHLVWRCWYNLRSTYMRGCASARWGEHLDFLDACQAELDRKRNHRRLSREQTHVPSPEVQVDVLGSSVAHGERCGTVFTDRFAHPSVDTSIQMGPFVQRFNFFKEQFQEDWRKISCSRGASTRLRNVRTGILEIVSEVWNEHERHMKPGCAH
uniref:Uncharacterized protein n=1 Tax=Steinernema glaseri TaxID=37863 RepID=A0A1I7Z7F6_9BILA